MTDRPFAPRAVAPPGHRNPPRAPDSDEEAAPALTFVLVHGGWHGGWCWREVLGRLWQAGHRAKAPTLTGLAHRAHLLSPATGLESHVRDVVDALERDDLRRVVLVGHSYGGMVIAGVAERAAARLARLVFLDAFVPADGRSLFDLLRPERRAYYEERAATGGDGWRVPPPPAALGVTEPGAARRLAAKLTPHPLRSFRDPIRLGEPAAAALPRAYVHCTVGPLVGSFAGFAERCRADPAWRYDELATGHDAMITTPGDLADLLLAPA